MDTKEQQLRIVDLTKQVEQLKLKIAALERRLGNVSFSPNLTNAVAGAQPTRGVRS